MKISVIIPVYNVEAYLPACLDSVIAQTHIDWEGILVDDASTDSSLGIMQDYVRRDPRFLIVSHKSNQGLSEARNSGIARASGEWITFLDSDDMLHPRFLEWMTGAASGEQIDIVSCSFKYFKNGANLKFNESIPAFSVMPALQAIGKILYQSGTLQGSACGKIFRKRLREDISFRPGILYEDLDSFYRIYEGARLTTHTSTPLYYYRHTSGSLTHTFSPRRADVLDVTAAIEEWAAETHPRLLAAARSRSLSAAFNILMLMKKNRYRDPDLYDRCRDIILRRRLECIKGPNIRLRNRLASFASYITGLGILKA